MNAAPPEKKFDWPLILFFVLAYAIAWGVLAIFSLLASQSGIESGPALMGMAEINQYEGVDIGVAPWILYLLSRLADFAFSIAGVIMIAVTAGRAGLVALWQRLIKWRFAWYWYLAALVPAIIYLVAAAAGGGLANADFSASAIQTALFSLQAGFFVSLLLRGAMGEEFGLRGFALPRLQEKHAPFKSSIIIGVLWGAWHLPVLIGRDPLSIIAFSLLVIGLSLVFTWLFNGSGGSLIPGLLFHALQNWEDGFEVVFPGLAGSDWELLSTLVLLVFSLVIGWVVWRKGKVEASHV